MTTTEYRCCWKTWRRGVSGQKVDTVIRLAAVDLKQAESFVEDHKRDGRTPAWIETREVTDWEKVTS